MSLTKYDALNDPNHPTYNGLAAKTHGVKDPTALDDNHPDKEKLPEANRRIWDSLMEMFSSTGKTFTIEGLTRETDTPDAATLDAMRNLPGGRAPYKGNYSDLKIDENVIKSSANLTTATKYLGMNEHANAKEISAFVSPAAGFTIDPRNRPWCADFVKATLAANGLSTKGLTGHVDSFLNYGKEVTDVKPGDLIILSHGVGSNTTAHIGFYAGKSDKDGKIIVLGGNQSDTVTFAEFDAGRVMTVRRADEPPGVAPSPADASKLMVDAVKQQQEKTANAADPAKAPAADADKSNDKKGGNKYAVTGKANPSVT